MAQAVENEIGQCPLCGDAINLTIANWRVPARWHEVLGYRDKWRELADQFRERRSLEEAAKALSLPSEVALVVLDFLCIEVCGCRTVTCVSCLDDYLSEL